MAKTPDRSPAPQAAPAPARGGKVSTDDLRAALAGAPPTAQHSASGGQGAPAPAPAAPAPPAAPRAAELDLGPPPSPREVDTAKAARRLVLSRAEALQAEALVGALELLPASCEDLPLPDKAAPGHEPGVFVVAPGRSILWPDHTFRGAGGYAVDWRDPFIGGYAHNLVPALKGTVPVPPQRWPRNWQLELANRARRLVQLAEKAEVDAQARKLVVASVDHEVSDLDEEC